MGAADGAEVCIGVGASLGDTDGEAVGDAEGLAVGLALGDTLGSALGASVGDALGMRLGALVGSIVGLCVGNCVTSPHSTPHEHGQFFCSSSTWSCVYPADSHAVQSSPGSSSDVWKLHPGMPCSLTKLGLSWQSGLHPSKQVSEWMVP